MEQALQLYKSHHVHVSLESLLDIISENELELHIAVSCLSVYLPSFF